MHVMRFAQCHKRGAKERRGRDIKNAIIQISSLICDVSSSLQSDVINMPPRGSPSP